MDTNSPDKPPHHPPLFPLLKIREENLHGYRLPIMVMVVDWWDWSQ